MEYAVQIGIIGLLAGIFVPLYAFYKRKILHHSMVLLFISMEYAAMITENIFDTQAALTLFIGFNCLFLSIKEYDTPKTMESNPSVIR